uniref:Uncharacterized protein n=1 Tax=Candidatus Kentrum sp. LPFa TaxID=2126335 RepID=A0A450VYF1_9GAMM|nr:MAG: hypothetical protein BECKLPF1236A_GA0070988_100288 [Candidatus Kentron sp. LPFa]VFK25691.1 MAG: hypothetical protein BECKLPF1236C_GA0070990_100249 [Candidatus Kentron sp. LPFa]
MIFQESTITIERNIYDWFEMIQNMPASRVKKILFEGDSWAAHPLRARALVTAFNNFNPNGYATLNIG